MQGLRRTTKGKGFVITVANQKGGVGKTTVTVNLSAALGLGGYRCLVIDLDPAAGATKHLGVATDKYAGSLELLAGEDALEQLVVREGMPKNVHLVPSRPQLSELDIRLSKYTDRTQILDRPIEQARQIYDLVFLDTGPSAADITTVAAYSTAEWILLSAFPHPLSLAGLNEALRDIADVRRHRNPHLEILGVIFSNVDGRVTRLRSQLETIVAQSLPGRCFESFISQAVLLAELSGRGITLFQLPGYTKMPIAHQYLRLAAEIEHRLLNRQTFLDGKLGPVGSEPCRTPHPAQPPDLADLPTEPLVI